MEVPNQSESKTSFLISDRFRTVWMVLGFLLVGIGSGLGLFSPTLSPLLQNSIIVVFGSVAVAIVLGGVSGWILGWSKVSGRVFWNAAVLAWAICPLAVQLSAFDAMFGRRNWLALFSEVSYGRIVDGYAAVIAVHSLASIPWVILLIQAGRSFRDVRPEKASALILPWWKTMLWISVPRNLLLFFAAAVVVSLFVFEQFQVTDVYQVRTWAEVWYLSFSMEQNSVWTTLFEVSPSELFPETWSGVPQESSLKETSSSTTESTTSDLFWPVLLFALGTFFIVIGSLSTWANKSEEQFDDRWECGSASDSLLRHLILGFTILLPCLFLASSLVARAGLKAKVVDGRASLGWSSEHFLSMFQYCVSDFYWPMVWSILIGIVTSIFLISFGVLFGWMLFRNRFIGIGILLLAAVSIATPAPLFSLICYESLFLSSSSWIVELANQSILGPVTSLWLKGIGLVTILYWTVFRTLSSETLDQAKLEGAGVVRLFWEFGIKNFFFFHLGFLLMVAVWAGGDLAGSFAVLPAGIDTVPRRILGDLHAGAGDKVAMICLIQLVGVFIVGFLSNLMVRTVNINR